MNATHYWSNRLPVGGLLAANEGNANLHALSNAGTTSVAHATIRNGSNTQAVASVSGQTSIESGGTLGLDAASILYAANDLSIIQGQGDITINPTNAARGTLTWSQIWCQPQPYAGHPQRQPQL